MQPKHVKEAFRLLNKSIIRVETPDVQFDDDEDEEPQEGSNLKQRKNIKTLCLIDKLSGFTIFCFYLFVDMDVDAESDTHPSGMVNGHTDTDTTKTDSDQKSKSKLRLSFEEYRSMARTIAGHLRAEEYRAGDGKSK